MTSTSIIVSMTIQLFMYIPDTQVGGTPDHCPSRQVRVALCPDSISKPSLHL